MRYDVELIVGSTGQKLQLIIQTPVNGYLLTNPIPIAYWITDFEYWTIGSQILLTDTNDPETWTVLATLIVTSFDPITQTFTATIDGFIDPDVTYNTTFYSMTTMSSSTVLELYENEVISQNWRFADLQTFAALGSFSRQFRIPATHNNLEALGYLPDANFKADVDYFQTKLAAELRVQTLPIAIGYLRVMRVITQADKLADFEVTFYAESPDLFNKIAGKKLKDIAALQNLNVILNYAEVNGASGYPYLYTLTDYGQKWDETGAVGSRSIYDESVPGCVRAGDLTPSLNWQWIFSKIIEEAGFTYTGAALDDKLYLYYAPWINQKTLKYVDAADAALFRYHLNSSQALTTTPTQFTSIVEDFDNGSAVSGGVFTAPSDGTYRFRIWFTGTNTNAGILVQGHNITTGFTQTMFTTVFDEHYDTTNTLLGIVLSAGDQFEILWRYTGAAGSSFTLNAGSSYETGTGVELYQVDVTAYGLLDWAANSPDVTQTDFLRDVLNMHCCVIVPQRGIPNSIVIEPIKDYIGSGSDRDWSNKLDITKDITLSNTSDFQNKRLTFTYTAGEDYFSKIFVSINRIYGDYKLANYTVSENDVPNDFAKDGEQKVQLVTQSTPANYINGTTIVIPKFVDASGDFVTPQLRCLFHADDRPLYLWNDAGNFPDVDYVVPILNHYEFVYPPFSALDLNWAPEVPLHLIGPSPYKTLFNLYWRDYVNQLYSPQARIMEAYFALDLADILSFKFSDRIWVKDAWWRILDINDYKVGSDDVTQVRLMKLIDAVPETSVTPSDVTSGGSVVFVDGNGDIAPGTRSACNRYGYRWDAATNTCYATTTTPQDTVPSSIKTIGTSTNQVANTTQSIVMADKLNNDPSNLYTLAVGTDIKMTELNTQSIAVGEKLIKEGAGGVSMFGRNVYTKTSGQHLGGGYLNNTPATSPEGYAQSGIVMYQSKYTFTSGGQYFIFIDGVSGAHLDLPDDTCWSCILNYTIQDDNLTGNYETGQLSFALIKSGGIASVSAITPLNVVGGIGSYMFAFGINVATTNLHRFYYVVSGSPFPDTFHVSASLTYTQSKLS